MLGDEEHRDVGELGVVRRHVLLLYNEARLGNKHERVEPCREAHAIEVAGAVGRLGVLGIDPMLLREALKLVADTQVVAEHRAAPECAQRRKRVRLLSVAEETLRRSGSSTARATLGREAESADHLLDGGVGVVDRLAADFRAQAVLEWHAVFAAVERVHPAADPAAGLEDEHLPARVAQIDGCGEAGQTRPDDDDPPGRCGIGPIHRTSRCCPGL